MDKEFISMIKSYLDISIENLCFNMWLASSILFTPYAIIRFRDKTI